MLHRRNSGFTLVEIIVVLAIVGLLSAGVGLFARNVFFYNRVNSSSLTTAQDARAIIRTISAELRSASPGNNGAYPITVAGTSTIDFFSDINGDGTKEEIRYFASSTSLYRGVTVPTGSPLAYATSTEKITLLASYLRNATSTSVNIFDYYTGDYNGSTTTPALTQPVAVTTIRLVKVTLILDVDQNSLPVSRTYATQVTLRNIKDNL